MNLLIDTHVLLWWLSSSPLLNNKARDLIKNPSNTIFVSAATAWEIAIKRALGKLNAPDDLEAALEANDFQMLAIKFAHAKVAGVLPHYHRDPFDRMLVAQAKFEELSLLSHDKHLEAYGLDIIPCRSR